jgi:hypothetical protein
MKRSVFRTNEGISLDQLLREIRAKGGQPLQAFPPAHVIANVPDGIRLESGHQEEVSPAQLKSKPGSSARQAQLTYEAMQKREEGAPEPILSWDTPGKKPPHLQRMLAPTGVMGAPMPSTGTPTSTYLVGRVGVAVVLVNRARGTDPDPPAEHMTQTERDNAVTEAAAGLGWLAAVEPKARVEFVFERHDVELTIAPDTATPDEYEEREEVWRDPALAKLDLPAGRTGYAKLAQDVRDRVGGRWGFVLFITRYPVHHFAYASAERIVMHYDNDGWGPAQLDRVIAHESAHIFGALDEYASSGCNCTDKSGELQVVNGNCKSCAASFVPCLMEANTFSVCDFTRGQLGWREPLIGTPTMWHTIRRADGSWQPFFGSVEAETSYPGDFIAAGSGASADELHLVGVTKNGDVWHTIRHADGSWQPSFGNVKGQTSNPGAFTSIRCTGSGAEVHLCGTTNDGRVWHTVRHADGTWQAGFGDVKGQTSNPGAFTAVDCAGSHGAVHVCGITSDGNVWHTIRNSDGSWQPSFGDVKGQTSNPGAFSAISCAGVGNELHVVGVTSDGNVWHTIRFGNGSWQAGFGDVKGQTSNPGTVVAVGCAASGSELHVCVVTSDGNVWHTIRRGDGTWQDGFGDVKGQTSNPGATRAVSCATVGNEVHVSVTT